jgi:hypothetical protein
MSHSELEVLFHEFGHALHSLLSKTQFQHLSGTRGAMDFVEVRVVKDAVRVVQDPVRVVQDSVPAPLRHPRGH